MPPQENACPHRLARGRGHSLQSQPTLLAPASLIELPRPLTDPKGHTSPVSGRRAQSQEESPLLSSCMVSLSVVGQPQLGRPWWKTFTLSGGGSEKADGLCQPFSEHELGWAPAGRLGEAGYGLSDTQGPELYMCNRRSAFLASPGQEG